MGGEMRADIERTLNEIDRAHMQGKATALMELGSWLMWQSHKGLIGFAPVDVVLTEINIRVEKLKAALERKVDAR
jgi:hypothetical protein